jgi:hypothetical protein
LTPSEGAAFFCKKIFKNLLTYSVNRVIMTLTDLVSQSFCRFAACEPQALPQQRHPKNPIDQFIGF